jgi:hypothetical protein
VQGSPTVGDELDQATANGAHPPEIRARLHAGMNFHAAPGAALSPVLCFAWHSDGRCSRPRERVSRAGRYTGGYPVPGCGKHISHQCRGDREEASPLKGGREMPSPPLRPSLGRPPNLEKPGLSSRIDLAQVVARSRGHRRTVPGVAARTHRLHPYQSVEKPTDNGPACLLCYGIVDAQCLEGVRPPLAPAHFPTPHAPGARGDFDGSTRSRAEGGTGRLREHPSP